MTDVFENDQIETWKEIPGWKGYYQVSDRGRIRSVLRVVTRSNGVIQTVYPRVMSLAVSRGGYAYTMLYREGVATRAFSHQLVMAAFIGPCPDGMEVCHNNGVRNDNRLINLRYDTREENMADKKIHGTEYNLNKRKCPRGHDYSGYNLIVRRKGTLRVCRSCANARRHIQRHPEMKPDFDRLADQYYAKYGPVTVIHAPEVTA